MEAVARYVAQVDAVLAAACGLLTPAEGGLEALQEAAVPVEFAEGSAGLAAGLAEARARYRTAALRISAADTQVAGLLGEALAVAGEAARSAAGIRAGAQLRAAALLPLAGTPAGLAALVESMGAALTAMGGLLSRTRAQLGDTARAVRRHSEGWAAEI